MRLSILFLFLSLSYNLAAQLVPDWSTYIVIGRWYDTAADSVKIGFSTNATEFFDAGYDVIDTSLLDDNIDLRIFNPNIDFAENRCYNLKESFINIPSFSSLDSNTVELQYFLVVKNDYYPSWFKYYPSEMTEYQFLNSAGWEISDIRVDGVNIYVNGIDNSSWSDFFYFPVSTTYFEPEFVVLANTVGYGPVFTLCDESYRVLILTISLRNRFYTSINDISSVNYYLNNWILSFERKAEEIIVFDLRGKFLFKIENSNKIDLNALEIGNYIITIIQNNQIKHLKISKI